MAMDTGICITCGADNVDLDPTSEQCIECEEAILSSEHDGEEIVWGEEDDLNLSEAVADEDYEEEEI